LLRSTIVLMPSRTEGFGLVGLEAIECGIPTLVSNQSGLAQLLRCRDLPEFVEGQMVVPVTTDPEATADEWARRIDVELHDPAAAFRRAANVRNAVAERFSWGRAAGALVAAIETQPKAPSGSSAIPNVSGPSLSPEPIDSAIAQVLGERAGAENVSHRLARADVTRDAVTETASKAVESKENIPENLNTLGNRVHYAMCVRDISANALDQGLGKEKGYTHHLLKSALHPPADTMSKLSRILGVPVSFLVEGQSHLYVSGDLRAVAVAIRRLRHIVRAPLGDVLARCLFDFPFIKSSSYPIEPELRDLAPLDVYAMGILALLVAAKPPTPEQDHKAIKVAFTIAAKALEVATKALGKLTVPHDKLTPELGSAWLEAMPTSLGADRSLPAARITAQSVLLSAKSYEEKSGTAPPLRIYPTWWSAAKNAKSRLSNIPPEYVDMVGDLRIPLDGDLTWQLVSNLARTLYEEALSGRR
jgi:hypothetical protein